MKKLNTLTCLIAFALAPVSLATAATHGIFFVPTNGKSLGDSKQHEAGASHLKAQLIASGIIDENLILVSGNKANLKGLQDALDATARRVETGDTLIVSVHSPGAHFSGIENKPETSRDFVCSSGTAVEQLDRAVNGEKTDGSVFSVGEIIDLLVRVQDVSKLLVIDGHISNQEAAVQWNNAEFGKGGFSNDIQSGRNKLTLTINASAAAGTTSNGKSISQFVKSLADGIARHADLNSDGKVTQLELAEYCQLAAKIAERSEPSVVGEATLDFDLVAVSPEAQGVALNNKARNAFAQTMLETARNKLLVEGDTVAATRAIRRAARYGASDAIKTEIASMLLTLIAHEGDFDTAWKISQEQKIPLLILIIKDISIKANAKEIGSLKATSLAEIDIRNAGDDSFIRACTEYRIVRSGASISFTKRVPPNGWITTDDVGAQEKKPKSDSALDAILQELYK